MTTPEPLAGRRGPPEPVQRMFTNAPRTRVLRSVLAEVGVVVGIGGGRRAAVDVGTGAAGGIFCSSSAANRGGFPGGGVCREGVVEIDGPGTNGSGGVAVSLGASASKFLEGVITCGGGILESGITAESG